MTKSASSQEKKPGQKSSANVKISPSAGRALVELVNELRKINDYEQGLISDNYKSFQGGTEIFLVQLLKPDPKAEKRRKEIVEEINRIVANGRG